MMNKIRNTFLVGCLLLGAFSMPQASDAQANFDRNAWAAEQAAFYANEKIKAEAYNRWAEGKLQAERMGMPWPDWNNNLYAWPYGNNRYNQFGVRVSPYASRYYYPY